VAENPALAVAAEFPVSKLEVVVAITAVMVVDAQDENQARIAAWKNLENKLHLAAKALGAELKLDDVVCSEPITTQ
jgi:hypothetical protein